MKSTLTLIGGKTGQEGNSLRKLAEFLGLTCEDVALAGLCGPARSNPDAVTAMDGATLLQYWAKAGAVSRAQKLQLLPRGVLLVCGIGPAEAESLLRDLTDEALSGVRSIPAGKRVLGFAEDMDRAAFPFAGCGSEIDGRREIRVLVPGSKPRPAGTLVTWDREPLLARFELNETELYLLSDDAITDLDAPCVTEEEMVAARPSLLPAAVFLRQVFGAACWSDPAPAANLIIDDPMIRRRYGFVEYSTFLAEGRRHSYAMTIAFIPFNHRRSHRATADFLAGEKERFSIAVHGCDHTKSEFGIKEPARLRHISRLAMERMRDHQRRVGMPFDSVMVFPQGVFSVPAFDALKRSGYDAVVNTEFVPRNPPAQPLLRVRDLLDGAVMAYAGFPLFCRRYPRDVFDFAVDLFWGKPVLVVEHHGYFKDGYQTWANFVAELRRVAPALRWKPLGEVVTGYGRFRTLGVGRQAVRFFTPTFRLRNPTAGPATFLVEKRETESDMVEGVTVDGRPAAFEVHGQMLRGTVELPASGRAEIKVNYRAIPPEPYRLPLRYRTSAALRRYLSEVRDNYVVRNPGLLSAATKVRRALSGKR